MSKQLGLFLAAVALSAAPVSRAVAQTEDRSPVVQYQFEVSPDARAHLDSLMLQLRDRLGVRFFAGSLDRFGTAAGSVRYFLFMIPPEHYRDGEILFFAIEGATVSDAFTTGFPFSPSGGGPSIAEIEDFDGDGLEDVAYCVGAVGEGRSVRVVGYRDGGWYSIKDPRPSVPGC